MVPRRAEGGKLTALGINLLARNISVDAQGTIKDPVDVDRTHERLWDWSDMQIARTWNAGPSTQNFTLFTVDAVRVPQP